MSEEQELLKLRNEIDAVDDELLAKFSHRARLAQRIGEIKQGNVYRPERDAQVSETPIPARCPRLPFSGSFAN